MSEPESSSALPPFPAFPPGTNVVSVGIDMESVSRIRNAIERHGENFLEKVFTPEEIAGRSEEKAKDVLRRMTHINDITPRNFVEVCVDMKQQGIAGFNSWGDRPLPEFTMPANQEYKWGFTLIPIK